MDDIRTGLLTAENPARFQVLAGRPLVIFDVAHNPHAATAMVSALKNLPKGGRALAVFAMLADKDMASVVDVVKPHIDHWYVAGLAGPPNGCGGWPVRAEPYSGQSPGSWASRKIAPMVPLGDPAPLETMLR